MKCHENSRAKIELKMAPNNTTGEQKKKYKYTIQKIIGSTFLQTLKPDKSEKY